MLTQNEATFSRECATEFIDDLRYFSLDEEHFFLEWASDLLDQVETLKMLRFELVPAKIKEDMFWRRYFAGMKRVITSEFFIDPDAKDYSHLQQNPIPNDSGAPAAPPPTQFAQPPQPVASHGRSHR